MLLSEHLIDRYLDVVVARALSEREIPPPKLKGTSAAVREDSGASLPHRLGSRSDNAPPEFSQGDGDGSVGENGQASLEADPPFVSAETRTVRSHPSRPQEIEPPDPED